MWGAASPPFLHRDEEIIGIEQKQWKPKNYERILEKAARAEEKLARVRESSTRVKEEAASSKSLYVNIQDKLESLVHLVET